MRDLFQSSLKLPLQLQQNSLKTITQLVAIQLLVTCNSFNVFLLQLFLKKCDGASLTTVIGNTLWLDVKLIIVYTKRVMPVMTSPKFFYNIAGITILRIIRIKGHPGNKNHAAELLILLHFGEGNSISASVCFRELFPKNRIVQQNGVAVVLVLSFFNTKNNNFVYVVLYIKRLSLF